MNKPKVTSMRCVVCKKGLPDVDALFRINAKGGAGLWACKRHRSQTDAPVDHEIDDLVDHITNGPRD